MILSFRQMWCDVVWCDAMWRNRKKESKTRMNDPAESKSQIKNDPQASEDPAL